MSDCIICDIVAGSVPSTRLYEDDQVIAFRDVAPRAPFHALVVPRAHVPKLSELDDRELGGHLLQVVRKVAADAGYSDNFRLVVNNGDFAGQDVWHLHMHVLGGRQFSWPPG